MRNSTKRRGSIDDYTIINQKENLSLGAVIEVADISKAERMLRYSPKVEIATGIREFVRWFKRHRQ
ncbi:hypothetical protein J7M22_01135 [Candidatus Poribacteria bacterium]|nr:hypothetical protein [Candidatus Poribacteria bacterium]